MSSISSTVPRPLPRDSRARDPEPPLARLLEWGFSSVVIGLLAIALIYFEWRPAQEFAIWGVAVFAADLLPVRIWRDVRLSLSLPALLAAAMTFAPFEAALLAFVASVDSREFKRQVSLGRALHNRSQVALSVAVAAGAFRLLETSVLEWPHVLAAALVAALVDLSVNLASVLPAIRITTGVSMRTAFSGICSGSPGAFFLGYLSFALLGLLLATVYASVGPWGLIAFMIPLFLARQSFTHWHRHHEAARSLAASTRALAAASRELAGERRDERRVIAGELHDYLLPPVYKVHLMGQVLKQDLAAGRLLDLDDDLPELLTATDEASEAIRDVIGGLRHSTLGASGLISTIELLVEDLRARSDAHVELRAERVDASPLCQLVCYQVVREAAENALKHAHPTTIRITVMPTSRGIEARVEDDGAGFVPELVDEAHHFGLGLMRERVRATGGDLVVQSGPRKGTVVSVWLPAD